MRWLQFGQSVDISGRFVAEILCEVDDAQCVGQRVLDPELCAFAVSLTEKEHVDGVEVEIGRKTQVGVAEQSLVDGADRLSGMAGGVDKSDLHLRVVDEQACELSCRVSGSAYDSCFHSSLPLRRCTLWYIFIWLPSILVNPLTSSALHALLTSPYSPKSVFIRSNGESTPTSV